MPAPSLNRPAVVYRFYDFAGCLLYVGSSCNRVRPLRLHIDKPWWQSVVTVTLEHFPDGKQALIAEAVAIRGSAPLYNIAQNPSRRRRTGYVWQ